MHLRAHGTMSVLLKELKDAPKDAGLALCTATVLFVLSQDRLNMDMDRDSLELMLNLLDTDSRIKVCTNSFIILNYLDFTSRVIGACFFFEKGLKFCKTKDFHF